MQKYLSVLAVVGMKPASFAQFKEKLLAELAIKEPACELRIDYFASLRAALGAVRRTDLDILYIDNESETNAGDLIVAAADLACNMARNIGDPWTLIPPHLKTDLWPVFFSAGVRIRCHVDVITLIGERYQRYGGADERRPEIDMSSYAGSHVYP